MSFLKTVEVEISQSYKETMYTFINKFGILLVKPYKLNEKIKINEHNRYLVENTEFSKPMTFILYCIYVYIIQ